MTREEAKRYLIEISYTFGSMSIEYLTEKDGEKMREAIETLEQEPETGYWILKGKGDGFKNWNCSKCGMLVRNSQKPWYKHCPNCGAKMVEPQESEG